MELNDVYAAVFGGYSAGLLSKGGNITVGGDIDVTVAINEDTNGYSEANKLSSTAVSTEDGNITVDGTATSVLIRAAARQSMSTAVI